LTVDFSFFFIFSFSCSFSYASFLDLSYSHAHTYASLASLYSWPCLDDHFRARRATIRNVSLQRTHTLEAHQCCSYEYDLSTVTTSKSRSLQRRSVDKSGACVPSRSRGLLASFRVRLNRWKMRVQLASDQHPLGARVVESEFRFAARRHHRGRGGGRGGSEKRERESEMEHKNQKLSERKHRHNSTSEAEG
jgi:hypothetical protein